MRPKSLKCIGNMNIVFIKLQKVNFDSLLGNEEIDVTGHVCVYPQKKSRESVPAIYHMVRPRFPLLASVPAGLPCDWCRPPAATHARLPAVHWACRCKLCLFLLRLPSVCYSSCHSGLIHHMHYF